MRIEAKRIGPAVWIIAFSAALAGSILLNKPLFKMVLALRPLGLALAFVLAFCGIGRPVVRRLGLATGFWGELSASFALGLGLTGLMVFAAGLFGVVQPALYALWAVAGFGLFAAGLLRGKKLPSARVDFANPLNVLAVVLIAVFFLQMLPPLAAPEVSTDALEYHLLIPKLYLSQGRIGPLPQLLESSYPSLAQYLYLFILPLGGEEACKAFHFWAGVFLLLAAFRLARRIKPDASLLAPALVFSMPVANVVFGWAWNDALFSFFAVSALVGLVDFDRAAERRDGRRRLLFAGVLAGLAGWTKYTVFLFLAALAGLALWNWARRRWKFRDIVLFFSPAAAVMLLVFVKNWFWTGNPVTPFLQSVFPGGPTNTAASAYFVKYGLQRLEIPDWTWSTYLLAPFKLTFSPSLVDIHPGIMPLVFLPVLFFRRVRKGMAGLQGFVAFSALLWLALFQTGTRSLLTTLAVLLAAGSVALEDILERRPGLRRAVVILLAGAALANLGTTIVTNYYLTRPIPYFLGKEDRAAYLLREAESQAVYDRLSRDPEVGTVLLVGLHKPYYLEKPFFFSGVGDIPIVERLTEGAVQARDVRTALAGRGITHVAVNQAVYERENRLGLFSWPAERKALFEEFLRDGCEEQAAFAGERIYKLR